jgi:hypothetical protein
MIYGYNQDAWEDEPLTCDECGQSFPEDQLVRLKDGWNFLACPECAAQCKIIALAEGICEQMLNEVLQEKTAGMMQCAFDEHASRKCALCLEPRPVNIAMQGNLFQEVA